MSTLAKRALEADAVVVPSLKRWKPSQQPALSQEAKGEDEVQEPTSVLDLQTSPGRSSSSSSGSLSSHTSLSGDETIHGVDATSGDHHDIASWVECMQCPLALAEEGIDPFVDADIDFGSFDLSLAEEGPFSMSAMLADDPAALCLMDEPKFLEGFHDAHLLDDDSLSSMMKETTLPEPVESGLQLVHLLLACAEAIGEADLERARPLLNRLKAISNPYGDPMQRIALYFADALITHVESALITRVESAPTRDVAPASRELAFQSFYEVLPFAKFTHFTANQAIFEAVGYRSRIHVVDLDVQQGLQWPSLLQTLALRPGGAPHLKITAVGTENLSLTQRRLTEFAQSLSVPFEFAIVPDLATLRVDADEALAVNCAQVLHGLQDPEALLRVIRGLNPAVVTLQEVEANHSGAKLMARFVEALHYYCALFDALEGSLVRDSPDRFLIENTMLFGEIRGIVEGGGRYRHVKSEAWESLFTKCGFRSAPLSAFAVQQAQLLLAYFIPGESTPYKLSEECGALIMGWQDTPVVAVSSWSC